MERRLQGAPRVDVVEQPLNGPLKDIHALAGWYSRAVKAVAATGNDEWAWKEHRFRLAEIFRAQSREWSNIALCVKKKHERMRSSMLVVREYESICSTSDDISGHQKHARATGFHGMPVHQEQQKTL